MIIYAHNINTGGALILLQELINRLESSNISADIYLSKKTLAKNCVTTKHQKTIKLKQGSYIDLFRRDKTEAKLYFGNLPPVFKSGTSSVYVHNAYFTLKIMDIVKGLVSQDISFKYLILTIYFRIFSRNCDYIFVQTDSMKKSLQSISNKAVTKLPFYRSARIKHNKPKKDTSICAIGLPSKHKIYLPFLNSIKQLNNEGYSLHIEMTIPDCNKNRELIAAINEINNAEGRISIHNHGLVDFTEIQNIYARSKALIYPSLIESFGLPLIEAADCGLKIFAPSLPYVDDVITAYTRIDPLDSTQIAVAIKSWIDDGEHIISARVKTPDTGNLIIQSDKWNEQT